MESGRSLQQSAARRAARAGTPRNGELEAAICDAAERLMADGELQALLKGKLHDFRLTLSGKSKELAIFDANDASVVVGIRTDINLAVRRQGPPMRRG